MLFFLACQRQTRDDRIGVWRLNAGYKREVLNNAPAYGIFRISVMNCALQVAVREAFDFCVLKGRYRFVRLPYSEQLISIDAVVAVKVLV